MKKIELAFFALCALMVLVGGVATVGAKNPIRGAMGLLTCIVGIAGMYLLLAAEFLAAIQILVYAGAVVILFLFVIMLLGPSATSGNDARTAIPRYFAAGVFLLTSGSALFLLFRHATPGLTNLPDAPRSTGTIEAIGHQLFTVDLVPFELSGALLLVAVVGAVAVARGKQIDPTLHPAAKAYAGALPQAEPREDAHPAASAAKPSHALAKEAVS